MGGEHTPGPWGLGNHNDWSVDGPGNYSSWHLLAKGRKAPIAILCEPMKGWRDNDAQLEANARLIAAAPDLLEALTKARGVLRDYMHAAGPVDDLDAALLTEISSALLKATARTTGQGVGGDSQ